jgi:hypothetical protein
MLLRNIFQFIFFSSGIRDESRLFARLNDIKGGLISTVRYIDAHANSVQSLDRFSPKIGQLSTLSY